MTDRDLPTFRVQLERLVGIFRPPSSLNDCGEEYWLALRMLTLAQIEAKVSEWIRIGKFFPKPAELCDLAVTVPSGSALTLATEAQRTAFLDAQRVGFERDACTCLECHEAGVTTTPQRFVLLDDHPPLALWAASSPHETVRTMVPGVWIHGWALHRWWQARDAYRAAHVAGRPTGCAVRFSCLSGLGIRRHSHSTMGRGCAPGASGFLRTERDGPVSSGGDKNVGGMSGNVPSPRRSPSSDG